MLAWSVAPVPPRAARPSARAAHGCEYGVKARGVCCGCRRAAAAQRTARSRAGPALQRLWSRQEPDSAPPGPSAASLGAADDGERRLVVPPPLPLPLAPAAVLRALVVLHRFSRPHTVLGSAVSVLSLTLMGGFSSVAGPAVLTAAFYRRLAVAFATAIVPALLVNLYIVGLNQLYDVAVDKLNKPYLPVASGEMSKRTGVGIVAASLVLALLVGGALPTSTPALRATLAASAVLGTVYSMPPFRLKRFPLLASFCILVVRGAVVNVGFFLHARAGMGAPPTLTPLSVFATLFFIAFGIIIALMKDIPDVRGDRAHDLRSFSVRYGARRIFWACVVMLSSAFFCAAAASVTPWLGTVTLRPARSALAAAAHAGIGASLLRRARIVRESEEDPKAVYSYYMYVWKTFYLEYVVLLLLLPLPFN